MTLAQLLDDLAGSEPVARPDLARRAWAQGRGDRARRWAQGGLAAAAVLAVLALVAPAVAVPGVGPSFARPDATVQGRPGRIGWQPWVRDLPARPGPVAALLQTVVHEDTHDEPGEWQVVAPDGHRWRLPGTAAVGWVPALSPDGRRVGWLLSDSGPYVVQDLVTGERTTWDDVGGQAGMTSAGPGRRYQTIWQSPGRFSPDGGSLVLTAAPTGSATGSERLLLDVATGGLQVLRDAPGFAAGWSGDDRIVWLSGGEAEGVRAVTTDRRGRVLAAVPLAGAPGTNQWSGVVASDGSSVAVLSDGGFGAGAGVRRYDLATGRLLGAAPDPGLDLSCGSTWAGGEDGPLVVQTSEDRVLSAVRVEADRTVPVAEVTARASGSCLVWAADALLGPAQGGPRAAVARWWRELVLLLLGTAGLGAAALRWRSRRAAPRPGG